ncbi:MAG: hypothetical protein Q9169_005941 [Polycauliona sp. 2 TL-2023]
MVSVTEDQNTAEQVFQSFREVADGKPYVTELDLRHSLIPDELVEDLLSSMPEHKGPDMQEDRHLPKYDYISFMGNMTQNGAPPPPVPARPNRTPPSTSSGPSGKENQSPKKVDGSPKKGFAGLINGNGVY